MTSQVLYVLTCALIIASGESRITNAQEAAYGVGTVSISTALRQVYFTLVHILRETIRIHS